jgi:Flp pilus assembly protein TadG
MWAMSRKSHRSTIERQITNLRYAFCPDERNSERGQSMVELALSLVILLLLLTVIVDGARVLFSYMALRDAAQEGSVFGSIEPGNNTGITARVRNASDMVRGFGAANIQVGVTYSGALCAGNTVKVRVTYPSFKLTMPFVGIILGKQTVPISATATDSILRPGC